MSESIQDLYHRMSISLLRQYDQRIAGYSLLEIRGTSPLLCIAIVIKDGDTFGENDEHKLCKTLATAFHRSPGDFMIEVEAADREMVLETPPQLEPSHEAQASLAAPIDPITSSSSSPVVTESMWDLFHKMNISALRQYDNRISSRCLLGRGPGETDRLCIVLALKHGETFDEPQLRATLATACNRSPDDFVFLANIIPSSIPDNAIDLTACPPDAQRKKAIFVSSTKVPAKNLASQLSSAFHAVASSTTPTQVQTDEDLGDAEDDEEESAALPHFNEFQSMMHTRGYQRPTVRCAQCGKDARKANDGKCLVLTEDAFECVFCDYMCVMHFARNSAIHQQ